MSNKVRFCYSTTVVLQQSQKRITNSKENLRHSSDREPLFAINVGLLLYAKTRKRQLIDALVQHGICISYDRALEISTQLRESSL